MTCVFPIIRSSVNVPLRLVLQGAFLALIVLMTPAVGQDVREERAIFDITLLGLDVATLEIVSRNDGKQYAVSSYLGSKGLAKLFIPTSYRVKTRGFVRADRYVPSRYIEERMTGQQVMARTIAFRNGTIASIAYDPPDQAEREFAERGNSGPSHDLINTLYNIARDRTVTELCHEHSVTFNGKDWTILEFGAAVEGPDETVSCPVVVYSSNDPAPAGAAEKRYELEFTYIPHPEDSGWYHLSRVTGETRIGSMTIQRRS